MCKWTAGEKLLYTTGSPVWCSVMTLRGGKEGGERGSTGRGYKCNCGWFTLLYGRNQHNIVKIWKKKLYKPTYIKKKKKDWNKAEIHTWRERMWTSSLMKWDIYFFTPTWLILRSSPRCLCNFLLRWISPQRSVGISPYLLWDGAPSLFDLQGAFLHMCRKVFLDLRSIHLISLLQQSSASSTSFVFGVSRWEKSFNLTPLDKHQLSSPGAYLSPTSIVRVDDIM